MSGKRPGGSSTAANGASNARSDAFRQKRAKLHSARNIPAQPAEAALKDGELDLQAFLAAHEFEIRSLEQSMATSKAVGASRAFQQVPRGLRRRTASHNPKRVPRRLRSRAKKEMQEDKTPLVESRKRKPRTTRARIRAETAKRLGILAARQRRKKLQKQEAARKEGKEVPPETVESIVGRKPRPKIKRNMVNEPPKPPARYRKRQINKTWLPTHKWHAKRARMTEPKNPLWRFAIPLTPTEKIYRPTHRAQGERGTMVWDMTYMSTIGVRGYPSGLEKTLRRFGVTQDSCWNEKGKKWRQGIRAWSGYLSREVEGHSRTTCPATIVWNPLPDGSDDDQNERELPRQIYIRIHPAAFLEVFNELVRLTQRAVFEQGLFVEDLRFEIGSIEFTGPASTEALLGVITPYATKASPKSSHAKLFESLRGLTNPTSLPANAVLGFSMQDPRLRYPPRKMKVDDKPQTELELLEKLAAWPAEDGLQPYELFDRQVRHQATCLPSQRAINKRRSGIEPGSFLKPTQVDPRIPILLMATRSPASKQAQGTWTLLMPWKCILPLWYSIVHCPLVSGLNPRFGGLNETMQVAFERGLPWFPSDFIGTNAGTQWELEQRRKRKRDWERRPKSKRPEWASLDLGAGRKGEVGDGLACDFEMLFDLPLPLESTDQTEELVTAEASDDAMNVEESAVAQNKKPDDAPPSLKLLHAIPKSTFDKMIKSDAPANELPPHPVLHVRLYVLGRGSVTTCARIYRLPTKPKPTPTSSNAEVPATIPPEDEESSCRLPHDLRDQWLARVPSTGASSSKGLHGSRQSRLTDMESRKRRLAQELTAPPEPYPPPAPNQVDIGGHPVVPDASDLIGFVTSGSYCLTEGKAAAVGSVAVAKVLPDLKANGREGRLCIVRNTGENVGWIARWEAV